MIIKMDLEFQMPDPDGEGGNMSRWCMGCSDQYPHFYASEESCADAKAARRGDCPVPQDDWAG